MALCHLDLASQYGLFDSEARTCRDPTWNFFWPGNPAAELSGTGPAGPRGDVVLAKVENFLNKYV